MSERYVGFLCGIPWGFGIGVLYTLALVLT